MGRRRAGQALQGALVQGLYPPSAPVCSTSSSSESGLLSLLLRRALATIGDDGSIGLARAPRGVQASQGGSLEQQAVAASQAAGCPAAPLSSSGSLLACSGASLLQQSSASMLLPLATGSGPLLQHQHQHQQHRGRHTLTKPLHAQPIDILQLDSQISSIQVIEDAAVPVFKYSQYLDPQLTTQALTRLAHLQRWQPRRLGGMPMHVSAGPGAGSVIARGQLTQEQQRMLGLLMQRLGDRFAQVAPHCSDGQLVSGLWALAATSTPHPAAFAAASEVLQARIGTMAWPQLSTAAWAFAAAGQRDAPLMVGLARRLAEDSAALEKALADGGSATQDPALDHKAVARLAGAFSALRGTVGSVVAGDAGAALARATAALLRAQLKEHDPALSGPLRPRFWYRYRTVRGPLVLPSPKPLRPSKYLRDNRPRMTPRDFELPGLASTLSSLERLGALSPPLLDTATRHLMASGLGPAPVQEGFPQPPSPHPRALQQGALRVLRLLCKQRRSAVTPAALPSPLLASHLLQPFAAASTRTPLHALATALRSAGAAGARAGDPSVRRLLALASASLASAARRQDLGGVGSSTGVSKYAQRAEERKEAARLASHSELQDLIQASTAQAQAQADGTQGAAAGTKAQAGSKTAAASSPSKGQQARSAAAAVGSKAAEAVAAVGSAVGSAVSSLVGRKGGRTAQDGAAASAGGKKGSAAWDSTEGYTVSKHGPRDGYRAVRAAAARTQGGASGAAAASSSPLTPETLSQLAAGVMSLKGPRGAHALAVMDAIAELTEASLSQQLSRPLPARSAGMTTTTQETSEGSVTTIEASRQGSSSSLWGPESVARLALAAAHVRSRSGGLRYDDVMGAVQQYVSQQLASQLPSTDSFRMGVPGAGASQVEAHHTQELMALGLALASWQQAAEQVPAQQAVTAAVTGAKPDPAMVAKVVGHAWDMAVAQRGDGADGGPQGRLVRGLRPAQARVIAEALQKSSGAPSQAVQALKLHGGMA